MILRQVSGPTDRRGQGSRSQDSGALESTTLGRQLARVLGLGTRLVALLGLVLGLLWPLQPGAALAVAGGSMFHFGGDRPSLLGAQGGHLQPCPERPNCVSSQSPDPEHFVEPIVFEGSARQAMQALKQAIDDSPRAEVIRADDNYLYAEFTSKLMGFVDDVEFYFDNRTKLIEVRSASRLGESDLGVNRKRVEALRQRFWTLVGQEAAPEGSALDRSGPASMGSETTPALDSEA